MAPSEPPKLVVVPATCPFRHWVVDGWCEPIDPASLPAYTSAAWEAHYKNDVEQGKHTARQLDSFPAVADVVGKLRSDETIAKWKDRLGYSICDDPTMHGGGLHVTEPGGWLGVHLDYDRHPKMPLLRRAINLIAFLNPEWKEEWGGGLKLCDPDGNPKATIFPKPGRLVAFEVGDLSYHGVGAVTGPVPRVTAAVYFLSVAGGQNTRRRALFIPNRGQT